jgi:Kef-type K+ transport system membrane component KefB/Trk K+ transport system NAD-binding subunit
MDPQVFIEISKILLVTILITGIIRLLKQPVIIGYILSGIAVGPVLFNIVKSVETLEAFSQIGVAFLLFMVGLSLNPRVIKDIGKISLITGLGQVIFTTSIGFIILRLLGFTTIVSAYIAIALAFSSTIIIMKLLSDKKDIETLYGRISVGFLIVQDFVAIIILLIISSLNNGNNLTSIIIESILKAIGGILVLFTFAIYVLPYILKPIAKSQEFLLLFSVGWCFAGAMMFHYLNLSIEAGALLAGICLSLSPYNYEISSKMKPLRDFFLILFFIILGSQMTFTNIFQNINIIIGLSLFVLIGNPIIVMIMMGLLKYSKRNGFMAGLTVAQISEFSLIVITMGVAAGHITNDILSLVTAIGLITFAGSSYMIMYSNKLYPNLSKFISIFERKGKKVDEHKYHEDKKYDIILMGYNRVGFDIMESLKKIKKKFLVIDYDPSVINRLYNQGYECRYGDANDSELLNDLNFRKSKMVISTIPLIDTNILVIKKVREQNKKVVVAVVAHQIDDAIRLYEEGATYVLMPHLLGGKHFSIMIEKNKFNASKFLKEKIIQLEHLKKRKNLGHENK